MDDLNSTKGYPAAGTMGTIGNTWPKILSGFLSQYIQIRINYIYSFSFKCKTISLPLIDIVSIWRALSNPNRNARVVISLIE